MSAYNDLIAMVGSWIHRADLDAVIPTFIALAEARMNSDLDIRQTDKVATITTSSGVNTIPLPADFKETRSISLVSGGVTIVLDKMPLGLMTQRWGTTTSSMPRSYVIHGNNLIVAPTPSGAFDLTIDYFANITPLSAINPTNDVLVNYPDMYLHAILIYAGQYIRDNDLVGQMESIYAADIARTNMQNWGVSSVMSMKQG
jgi:hypothetical protein